MPPKIPPTDDPDTFASNLIWDLEEYVLHYFSPNFYKGIVMRHERENEQNLKVITNLIREGHSVLSQESIQGAYLLYVTYHFSNGQKIQLITESHKWIKDVDDCLEWDVNLD